MSRRRYISTDISTDAKIAELAEYGTLPLLLYTWAIPHMDDWGRMTGDARQFKLLVCPALDVSTKEVDEALDQIASVGLWQRYEVDGKKYIAIPKDSWFKHQSYINKSKREDDSGSDFPAPPNDNEYRKTPQNTEEQQVTSQNTVSPSPSPSLSPSENTTTTTTNAEASDLKTLEQAYCDLHGVAEWQISGDDSKCMISLLSKGIPVSFIIEVMKKVHKKKTARGGSVNGFSYYEKPIQEAWKIHNVQKVVSFSSKSPSEPPPPQYFKADPNDPITQLVMEANARVQNRSP